MTNQEIADLLYQYADLLEAAASDPYRVRAYRRAARVISTLDEKIHARIENNEDITTVPSIGSGIAFTIKQIVTTKTLPVLKKPKISHKQPRIRKFLRLYHAIPTVNVIINHLNQLPYIKYVECCGAFRRRQELVEHLDFIISCDNNKFVREQFSELPFVAFILSSKRNSITIILWSGVIANFYFVKEQEIGAALLHYTGSESHVQGIKKIAAQRKLTLNEKGLYKQQKCVAAKTEAQIYKNLKLDYIAPELRENRGEIDAAQKKQLPQLIDLTDIKGDLHTHTTETDGKATLEQMVAGAAAKGYQYFAVTDHSKRLRIANGMDEKRLLNQIKQIDKLNEKSDILILKSIEVDILEDGSLDLSNDVLKELDIVVCSIHSKFRISEQAQTARIIKAMQNPYFNILGHATGRLIKSRNPYDLNIPLILQAAKDNGCYIELNSQPYRLDINDIYCKMAKEFGVKIAISSDAHSVRELNFMNLGINQARRGWLQKEDIINSRDWPALKKLLKQY